MRQKRWSAYSVTVFPGQCLYVAPTSNSSKYRPNCTCPLPERRRHPGVRTRHRPGRPVGWTIAETHVDAPSRDTCDTGPTPAALRPSPVGLHQELARRGIEEVDVATTEQQGADPGAGGSTGRVLSRGC